FFVRFYASYLFSFISGASRLWTSSLENTVLPPNVPGRCPTCGHNSIFTYYSIFSEGVPALLRAADPHPHDQAVGRSSSKGKPAVVGADDLLHDPQAQPVLGRAAGVGGLGAGHRRAPVESAQLVRADPRAVVGHRKDAAACLGRPHHHLDAAAAGVVVHT